MVKRISTMGSFMMSCRSEARLVRRNSPGGSNNDCICNADIFANKLRLYCARWFAIQFISWKEPMTAANKTVRMLTRYKAWANDLIFSMLRNMPYEEEIVSPGFVAGQRSEEHTSELQSHL